MPLPSRVSDLTGFDLLLSVARTGSIGRAAAEHGVSQPAASARMRLLEGQLGLALIERSPRGSRLTPAGALVAVRAIPVTGVNLNRTLRAVWTAGRPLTGPARDLYAIAARSARR